MTDRHRLPTPRSLPALLLAALLAFGSGCQVERARDTEACIDEAMEEGLSAMEAQQECMGLDDDADDADAG